MATDFRKVKRLGEGAHGVVNLCEYIGSDPRMPRYVAVKRIRMRDANGLSMDAVRELKLLQEIDDNEHILPLLQVFIGSKSNDLHLVLEFMHTDLADVIKNRNAILKEADIKQFMAMMLRAVAYCHANWILHRDIKPGNCLVRHDGVLKLADFGLAKIYGSPNRLLSPQACTLWYRAPELLFGANYYGPASDMWSIGCVFGELMTRVPLFQGQTELDQLARIFAVLGTPTKETWPGVDALPNYVGFETCDATPFEAQFPASSPEAIDLISKMLTFDPLKRITAPEALEHAFFHCAPHPTPLHELPLPEVFTPELSQEGL